MPTVSRRFQPFLVSFAFFVFVMLLLTSCSNERKLPPAPSTPPSLPSESRIPAHTQAHPALGKAYASAKAYAPERPDLIISPANLLVSPATLTFLPGETEKKIVVSARDDFIWKDAYILKGYVAQSDYQLKPIELSGAVASDVQAAGLRWLEKQSDTPLAITRDDLNTAPPYNTALMIFVHTQPGAGPKVDIFGEKRDVWLVGLVYFKSYNDYDDAPEVCAGKGAWIEKTTSCCGDDANEYTTIDKVTSQNYCCQSPTATVLDGECIEAVGLPPGVSAPGGISPPPVTGAPPPPFPT